MSDDGEEPSGVSGALSVVGDRIGDLVTGIPAPIRKNAFKAFARLCTAAVDYPVSLIEGAITQKRAEAQARVKLINASADQIAAQMRTDPEYARAAARKFAHKIIRERVNVDQISEIAAGELKSLPKAAATVESEISPISEDWLNAFENEAAQLSSEQMQLLFGKILAGEIRRPTSYSIKTVKLMAQLDNRSAALFKIVCSLAVSIRVPGIDVIIDARVIPLGNPGMNSLQLYGLNFDALNILEEYGLIISEYNSHMDYRAAIVREGKVGFPLTYQNRLWALLPKETPPPMEQEFRVAGVGLTRSGKELLPVIEIDQNDKYSEALKAFFDGQGMVLTPVQQPAPA